MSKRMKVLVSVLAAILLLTVGITTSVMAEDEEPTPTPPAEARGLLARVAEILEIPQEDLVNAFKQAQQEMRQEAFIRSLDRAVEKGRLTQEEADEIKGWSEQKPEALDRLTPRSRIFKARPFRQRIAVLRGWGGPGPCQVVE